MPRPPTEDERLEASSARYLALQVCAVPLESGIALFTSYGQHRTLREIFETPEELWYFLTENFQHEKAINNERRKHAEALACERTELSDNLNLDLDLDI